MPAPRFRTARPIANASTEAMLPTKEKNVRQMIP